MKPVSLIRPCVLLLLLTLAGCASTEKRYEKAQTLEAQGRHAEAAAYYIKVIDREPDWADARERLHAAGTLAIDAYLDEARTAETRRDYDEAIRLLNLLDALRHEASTVGVPLDVPADYTSYRRSVVDRAVALHLQRGEDAEQHGDWSQALRAYQTAATYAGDPAAFTQRQARVYLAWGEHDAARTLYRAAFEHAQHTMTLLGPDHPLSRRAAELQQDALQAGTRFVAFLPLWPTDDVRRQVPESLPRDLNDLLLYDYWAAPPPFIVAADPVRLRRELRRLHYDRHPVTCPQAAEIGRVVEADYVVLGTWTSFEHRERDVKEKPRTATLKGRGSTVSGPKEVAWSEQTLTLSLEAGIEYRLIDPRTRREIDRGSVTARASDRIKRGVYPEGDYRDLNLSDADLRLFEDDALEAVQDIENHLVDELAERLADRVYHALLNQIP